MGRARARLVVADRLGRHGLHHVGDQQPAVQEADARTLRQRVHRRDAGAGTVERRDQQASRERDGEIAEEADEIRYMVYALDGKTGKVKWEREAIKAKPFGGRHRKNTYASETPFTDGERVYVSFGQNVGLFVYSLDGTLLWKKQWEPKPIYLDFGTGSSPIVSGRPGVSAAGQRAAVPSRRSMRRPARSCGARARGRGASRKSSWMTPFVWKNALRTEIITTGQGEACPTTSRARSCGASPDGDADRLAVRRGRPALRRHRIAGRRQPSVPRGQARRDGATSRPNGETSNDFIVWRIRARRATPRPRSFTTAAPISSTTPASSPCSTQRPGNRSTRCASAAAGRRSRPRRLPWATA